MPRRQGEGRIETRLICPFWSKRSIGWRGHVYIGLHTQPGAAWHDIKQFVYRGWQYYFRRRSFQMNKQKLGRKLQWLAPIVVIIGLIISFDIMTIIGVIGIFISILPFWQS